ncbi:TIGR02449 family protein [Endozoicomonas ascidiicola]|uniref:TIGR02449 family protein n=1 Tax=Endozoicomonas ascidiicola TaxID=1698521 RepID=UPI0008310634|nr:TIGR02449 family protein [Endozoicomonas ascidiicola]
MNEPDFNVLDRKISYLLELCERLTLENRQLRQQELSWKSEKAKLMENNDIARNKVELMIQRLRSLELES